MLRLRVGLLAALGLAAVSLASLVAYRAGFSRGVDAGQLAAIGSEQVGQGARALMLIGYLESGRHDALLADLDARVDAGISAHYLRAKAPWSYPEIDEAEVEIVEDLAAYRRSRPSAARGDSIAHQRRSGLEVRIEDCVVSSRLN